MLFQPRNLWVGIIGVLAINLCGCATYSPRPLDDVPFRERAKTQTIGKVRVTVAALRERESKKLFAVSLAKQNIQPVWVEVQNDDDVPYLLLQLDLDPFYYSPLEVSYKNRLKFLPAARKKMDEHFERSAFYEFIAPGTVSSGFVFASLDEGSKAVTVSLLGPQRLKRFNFIVEVGDIRMDYQEVDFDALYDEDEIVHCDETELRDAIRGLPAATKNKKGTKLGDPLNLIIVADMNTLFSVFIRAGWDETETLYSRSARVTAGAFLFRKKYRYSPIGPLFVFGRSQDLALQKARDTIDERTHLRLWMTNMRFEGKPVWFGQISRDIGVRFTRHTWNLTTHKIDPDIDSERWYLIQDLIATQGIARIGFVGGVGAATFHEPRKNLTGDPYYTDGLRVVMFLTDETVSLKQLRFLDWEFPPTAEEFRAEWLSRN